MYKRQPVLFPREDAAPYHIYHKVLNAKHFGVPQNRERVFIIGIRDVADNTFSFPKPFHLTKRLKDVLETEVDEKYYLSDKAIEKCLKSSANSEMDKKPLDEVSRCLIAGYFKIPFDGQYVKEPVIKVNSATKKGYETAMIGAFRGRNPKNPSDRTTGAPMEQTLEINKSGTSNTITSVQKDNVVVTPIISDYKSDNPVNSEKDYFDCLRSNAGGPLRGVGIYHEHKIRRLTPRECFRLMDFPDTFTWPVSDTQAYKQAGNSIVVNVLYEIINKLVK